MKTEDKTDNELIAEFMGYKYYPYNPEEKGLSFGWIKIGKRPLGIEKIHPQLYLCRTTRDLGYDRSWDWLMPVVEKIDELYKKAFPTGEEFISRVLEKEELFDGPYMDVVAVPISTPINEVYEAVVKFIKWYNSQTALERTDNWIT